MKWGIPPAIKVYEALGAIADKRLEVGGNTAKVYSSSGNKYYDVRYDPDAAAIMVNDNGSFYKGYLGYPAIAFLLEKEILPLDTAYTELLEGIPWKDINTRFKNGFDKTLGHIQADWSPEQKEGTQRYVADILIAVKRLGLSHLGEKQQPPEGY